MLGVLVYDYEQQNEVIPTLKGLPLLEALLEESNLEPKDLISICGSESRVLNILNGKSNLTENEIQGLAAFFKISPNYFYDLIV